MAATAPAEVRRDAKAGYCSRCRNGQHSLCASPADRCGCPYREHPNRPGASPAADGPLADVERRAQASAAPAPKASTPPAKAAAKLREPAWQLVKADPPAPPPPKPKRLTVVERARPFVEQLVAEGDRDWHRFAIFPGAQAASQCRARIAKAYPEMEFKAVRVAEIGQSALYGRWTGKRPAGQL